MFPIDIGEALKHARALVAKAEDEAAKQVYLGILRADPTHPAALNELGTLALSGGFRTAARSAYLQAVRHHPRDKIVRVNLANLLREEHDLAAARLHYQAALAIDPDLPWDKTYFFFGDERHVPPRARREDAGRAAVPARPARH